MNLDLYFCQCGREFKHAGPCWNRKIVIQRPGPRAVVTETPIIRANPVIRGARFINGRAVGK